ncbi:uroporphyrinogen decarboxylase [Actinomyces bowdenii]|nr:uroporphyrinogen decarboxylase [Actinomyces bowdenii]
MRSGGPAPLSAPQPPLLEALGGRAPSRTPVWFMRQAGRSLPEYRRLRAGRPMLESCLDPGLAAEITLQPVRRHGVDGAVLFSDIMVPLLLAGVGVRIAEGVGPVLDSPVRSPQDIEALIATSRDSGRAPRGRLDPQALEPIAQAVGRVVAELGAPGRPGAHTHLGPRARAGLEHSAGQAGWTPVIGFGGAPFTLAAYMVEGRPSRDHLAARTLMHSDPATWERLMTWCASITGSFMAAQVRAGAAAAQLFDSWAGSLSPTDYRERVLPYSALALQIAGEAVSPTTGRAAPLIHFGTGTARLLAEMRRDADAVGVDERIGLRKAAEILAATPAGACPVQGNIDPALLAAPEAVLGPAVERCLEEGGAAPAHVVNLGHGVPPGTDPDVLTGIVAQVHGSDSWRAVSREGWDPQRDEEPGA